MSTYRVGNHQPQNIYQGECCGVGMCSCSATPEDAALAVEALNGTPASQAAARCAKCGNALAACQDCGEQAQCGEPWCADCQPDEGWLTSETVSAASIADVMAIADAPYQPGLVFQPEDDDSCTCSFPAKTVADAILDDSCTCPRHGAVM